MIKTYAERVLAGENLDIDDCIEAWHTSGPEEARSLQEYLGFTEDEMSLFVMFNKLPERLRL